MSGLQEKLETAIRGTLMDPEGAGSDLEFCREIAHPWVHLEGNLDVQHLASHVIDTLEVEYEYAVQGTNVAYGTPYTGTWMDKRLAKIALEEFKERPEDFGFGRRMSLFKDFKLVRRRKAGPIEDA